MTAIPDTELVLVVAADENNVIGLDGGVPWNYPEDVRQYKNRIAGHPIILGRRTFESMKPIPDCYTVVLTSDDSRSADSETVEYATTPQIAVEAAARAGATVLAVERNPASFRFLVENARRNGVADSVLPILSDCRDVLARRDVAADRVLMGHYDAESYVGPALDALAPGGRVVTYGLASGEVPCVSTPRLIFGNHSVVGYHLGHAADHDRQRVFGAFDPVLSALSAGDASVQVDRVFDLDDAAAAHEHVENRRTRGKVLLEP